MPVGMDWTDEVRAYEKDTFSRDKRPINEIFIGGARQKPYPAA